MFKYQFAILRLFDEAGEGGGGGGGGGGGAQGGAPKPFTKEDAEKMIGAAVNNMNKRLEGKIAAGLEDVATKFGASFEELKTVIANAAKPADPPAPKAKDKDSADDDRYNELKKNFEQLKLDNDKALKQAAQERAAREAKELEIAQGEERSVLSKALEEGGLKDARRAGAAAYLYLDQKKIKRNEKNEVCFMDKDEYGEDVLVPVAVGVKKWLGTDEGKSYLPPVDAQGTGNRGGNAGGSALRPGEKMTTKQAENVLFSGAGIGALFGE